MSDETRSTMYQHRLTPLLPPGIEQRIRTGDLAPVADFPDRLGESTEDIRVRRDRAAASRRRMWTARQPQRFAAARIETLSDGQSPDRLSRFLTDPQARTLVLYSPESGVGKTHAAYAVGNRAVEDGAWAAAWSMVDFNDALRPGADETAYLVAQECDLLVLDDLGRERLTEWTLERLCGVIDARWRDARRTVLTTQLSGEGFVSRYGDPLADRLRDGMWHVTVTGDRRRKPAPW